MSLHFATESGSQYEIDTIADGRQYVRRVNDTTRKRADGDFVRLYSIYPNPLVEGIGAVLEMESLAGYGVDDHGTPATEPSITTIRSTTTITRIWEDEE